MEEVCYVHIAVSVFTTVETETQSGMVKKVELTRAHSDVLTASLCETNLNISMSILLSCLRNRSVVENRMFSFVSIAHHWLERGFAQDAQIFQFGRVLVLNITTSFRLAHLRKGS
jgi:hypothetical protein